jgi:hypothetical protein
VFVQIYFLHVYHTVDKTSTHPRQRPLQI